MCTSKLDAAIKIESHNYRAEAAGVGDQKWQVAGVGDFNGDGKYEILWRNANSGQNTIWKSAYSASALNVPRVTNLALGALAANKLESGSNPVANLASAHFLYTTGNSMLAFDADRTGATRRRTCSRCSINPPPRHWIQCLPALGCPIFAARSRHL